MDFFVMGFLWFNDFDIKTKKTKLLRVEKTVQNRAREYRINPEFESFFGRKFSDWL